MNDLIYFVVTFVLSFGVYVAAQKFRHSRNRTAAALGVTVCLCTWLLTPLGIWISAMFGTAFWLSELILLSGWNWLFRNKK